MEGVVEEQEVFGFGHVCECFSPVLGGLMSELQCCADPSGFP